MGVHFEIGDTGAWRKFDAETVCSFVFLFGDKI